MITYNTSRRVVTWRERTQMACTQRTPGHSERIERMAKRAAHGLSVIDPETIALSVLRPEQHHTQKRKAR